MPTGQILSAQGTSSPPFRVQLSSQELGPKVPLESIKLEETGTHETAQFQFDIRDVDRSIIMHAEATVSLIDTTETRLLFKGFVKDYRMEEYGAVGRVFHIVAYDTGHLLDKILIPSLIRNPESDRARLSYLMGVFASNANQNPGSYGLIQDTTHIRTINSAMPTQRFTNMTLRTAIEAVAALAKSTARYYIDVGGALHYFDGDESVTAPYDINVTQSPSSTEVNPIGLDIDVDSTNIANAYWVRGKTAAGSSPPYFVDTASITAYARKEAYVDAPDSDDAGKRLAVASASLKDTKDPITRGTFAIEGGVSSGKEVSYRTISGSRRWWAAGQLVTVTSPLHNLTSYTDRIVRITHSYMDGNGRRRFEIEFGGTQPRYSTRGS